MLAGGFSFSKEKTTFEEIKKSLNATVDEMLDGKTLSPALDIDMELSIDDVDVPFVEELSKLEPFGMNNQPPTFAVKNLVLKEKKLMGSTKEHLKLIAETPNGTIDCVWWSKGDIPLIKGDKMDVAFSPQVNTFNGVTNVQLIVKDIHSKGLEKPDEDIQKVYDHRRKTNIFAQVDEYIKNSKKDICVFVENRNVLESLKPYKNICNTIVNRLNAHKCDVLMFFDYPADEDILNMLLQKTGADSIHYMNYISHKNEEEQFLKVFSGMIKYTCNNLDGEFNLMRGASALGVTSDTIEVMLEMFEDTGMIKISERDENIWKIKFLTSIELSKVLHTTKYAELAELMNTIIDYKEHFMNVEL